MALYSITPRVYLLRIKRCARFLIVIFLDQTYVRIMQITVYFQGVDISEHKTDIVL